MHHRKGSGNFRSAGVRQLMPEQTQPAPQPQITTQETPSKSVFIEKQEKPKRKKFQRE